MAYLGYDMGEEIVRRRREQAMRGQPATSDMDSMRRFTDGSGPMPKDWSPGDETYGSGKAVGMTPMTPDQQQAIQDVESRPTAQQVVNAGQQGNWIENQADVNDATARLGGMFLGEGYNDRPTWTEESRLAGEALNRGLETGREQKAAMDRRDAEIERLRAVQTDPAGAEMYARYQKGDIAGYEITSNPNISPYWKRKVAEEPVGSLDPSRYGKAQLPGSSSRKGMPDDVLRGESTRQIGRVIDRVLKGLGNRRVQKAVQDYANAAAELAAARDPNSRSQMSDQDLKKLENRVKQLQSRSMELLGPTLERFQSRFDKEGSGSVLSAESIANEAIIDAANESLSRKASRSRYSGQADRYATSPATGSQSRRSRSQRDVEYSPSPPTVRYTAGDQPVYEFEKIQDAFVSSGYMQPGSAVKIGNRVMMPHQGPGGMALMDTVTIGDYYVTDPRAFAGNNPAESAAMWGESLTDEERKDFFRHLIVEGGDQNLSDSLKRRLRSVYKSRQDFNEAELSSSDREKALKSLYDTENRVLYDIAVASAGKRKPEILGAEDLEAMSSRSASGSSSRSSSRPADGSNLPLPQRAESDNKGGILDAYIGGDSEGDPEIPNEFMAAFSGLDRAVGESVKRELILLSKDSPMTVEEYSAIGYAMLELQNRGVDFDPVQVIRSVLRHRVSGLSGGSSGPAGGLGAASGASGEGQGPTQNSDYKRRVEQARKMLADPNLNEGDRAMLVRWLELYPNAQAYTEANMGEGQ